ncbi:hypothetical protein [Paraburkholderia pallida]|uniref:Uncharacterized protein n=1 Tax=Paraburkholderia pallida TaxID=2547399 RepID=A0A4P7CY02_9BURK|nr:hypothetical protein [Paraburkholderia pallida]QBQ99104.1 hypothetical protein E1956_17945 [Paraburkholderia pallida]
MQFRTEAAAVESVRAHMQALLASVESMPPGVERDRAIVEDAVQFTYDWPGVSTLANRIADSEPDGDPQLVEIGLILYAALGIDLKNVDVERVVRVTSAFSGLGIAALQAVRADMKREWRAHIVQAAMNALGHGARRVR